MKKLILIFMLIWTLDLQAWPGSNDTLSLVQQVEQWYENHIDYYRITTLMAVESSFIPFPSEAVVPPAAYVASNPGSRLNMVLIIFFATLGAIIGAFVNYFLSLWLGRPIIYRFADSRIGHLSLLSREKIEKAENFFNKHGEISTFVGRLIPGIRQLISIPAGLAQMNLWSFTGYTTLGAGIWNIIMVVLGCVAHGQTDWIIQSSHEIGWSFAALTVIIIVCWLLRQQQKKRTKNELTRN